MKTQLKASLVGHIQKWLEKNADDIGDSEGIWQDNTCLNRNAEIMGSACEAVIDSASLQNTLKED